MRVGNIVSEPIAHLRNAMLKTLPCVKFIGALGRFIAKLDCRCVGRGGISSEASTLWVLHQRLEKLIPVSACERYLYTAK